MPVFGIHAVEEIRYSSVVDAVMAHVSRQIMGCEPIFLVSPDTSIVILFGVSHNRPAHLHLVSKVGPRLRSDVTNSLPAPSQF